VFTVFTTSVVVDKIYCAEMAMTNGEMISKHDRSTMKTNYSIKIPDILIIFSFSDLFFCIGNSIDLHWVVVGVVVLAVTGWASESDLTLYDSLFTFKTCT